jgi:oleate hydratase
LPQQPYFFNQPDGVYVFWGNGLYPDQEGMFVKKPMTECTGQELLTELLHHLNFPLQPMLEKSTTVPCLMPFIGSPFLTRRTGDRPRVIPDGSQNLGLLGQFVELDRDVTFTMEYSVRAAQTAVYTLMGLDKQPHPVHQGDHSVQVLGEALMTIMS